MRQRKGLLCPIDVSPGGSIEVVAHHRIFVLLGRIEGGILVIGDRSVIEIAVEVANPPKELAALKVA
jgi:hypothetical protein